MRVPLQVNIICKDPIGGYPLTEQKDKGQRVLQGSSILQAEGELGGIV